MLPVPSSQKKEGASLCPVWLGYVQVALREEGTAEEEEQECQSSGLDMCETLSAGSSLHPEDRALRAPGPAG